MNDYQMISEKKTTNSHVLTTQNKHNIRGFSSHSIIT